MPDNLTPRSKSIIPSDSPNSQWGFARNGSFLGSPQLRTTTFSLESLPTGTFGPGILGIWSKRSVSLTSRFLTSSSRSLILVRNARPSSAASACLSLDACLRLRRRSSSSVIFLRFSASICRISSSGDDLSCRLMIACLTTSGFSRINFISNIMDTSGINSILRSAISIQLSACIR